MTGTRIDQDTIRVRIDVVGANPCVTGPAIDVHVDVYVRQICGPNGLAPPEYRVEGMHDGYPWHELYINGTAVYFYDPYVWGGSPSSLWGDGDWNVHWTVPAIANWRPVP